MNEGRSSNFEVWLRSQTEPAHLLLVEDSEDICKIMRGMSRDYHCILETVPDAPSGLALAARKPFRLILVDIYLQGDMTGVQMVQALKAQGCKVPVVIVSGYVSMEIFDTVSEFGFVPVVKKPGCFTQKFIEEMFLAFNIPKKPETRLS